MATSNNPAGSANGPDELRAIELLASATNPDRGAQSSPTQTTASLSPHGYSNIASQATRAVADSQRQERGGGKEDEYIHPDLRSRPNIMPAANNNIAPAANMMPSPIPPPTISSGDGGPSAADAPIPSGASAGSDDGGGRKGKRELSQSKRAAQNRAAQRAFRRRKEEYIKKLEEKVGDAQRFEEAYRTVSAQNTLLREYALRLQSELVQAQGKIPDPPPGISLTHPPPFPSIPTEQPDTEMHPAQEPLAAIAQAVMTPTGPAQPTMTEDDRTDEEINRQLRTDGLP